MSLLYSILKPVVRKVVKGSSLHWEESYEEFKQASYDIQKKFRFRFPAIRGYEFRDEPLDGFHIIVGKKAGSKPDRAIVYFPGGGSRRWQLPYKSFMKKYICETGAELWEHRMARLLRRGGCADAGGAASGADPFRSAHAGDDDPGVLLWAAGER